MEVVREDVSVFADGSLSLFPTLPASDIRPHHWTESNQPQHERSEPCNNVTLTSTSPTAACLIPNLCVCSGCLAPGAWLDILPQSPRTTLRHTTIVLS